ncbi:MAG: PEP-CTERM sorting domain-containing protein [Alphaproteobacteria bacterium]
MPALIRCWLVRRAASVAGIKSAAPAVKKGAAALGAVRRVRRARRLAIVCVVVAGPVAGAAVLPPLLLSPPNHSGGGTPSRQVATNTDSPWAVHPTPRRDGRPIVVPEPASAALLATAVAAFWWFRR